MGLKHLKYAPDRGQYTGERMRFGESRRDALSRLNRGGRVEQLLAGVLQTVRNVTEGKAPLVTSPVEDDQK